MRKHLAIVAIAATLWAMLQPAFVAATPRSDSAAVAVQATDEDVRFFPNPVESELNVLCEKYDVERLMIFSATGDLVFNIPMTIAQGSRLTVNMSSRPAGYYTIKVWVKGAKQPLTARVYKM